MSGQQGFTDIHDQAASGQKEATKDGVKVSQWTIYALCGFSLGLAAVVGMAVALAETAEPCRCQHIPAATTTSKMTIRTTGTIPKSNTTTTSPPTSPTTPGTTCPPASDPDPQEYWDTCLDLSQSREQCMPGIPDCPDTSDYRIPARLRPSHYDIELKPDIYTGDPDTFIYHGKVGIDMTCYETTNTVYLHYRDMTINDSSVQISASQQDVAVTGIASDTDQEFYIIYLARAISTGEEVRVSMEYSGPINHLSQGMSWNRYLDENMQERYHLSTQLQSTDARRAFPCMDEPELKSTFSLSIWRKPGYLSRFNSELVYTNNSDSDWHLDVYNPSPVMSTYLVAFLVGQFSSKSSMSLNGHRVNIWAPPHWINAGYADYTNQVSYHVLDYFDDLFKVRYPLNKLDQAVAVDYGGAMENWGMIFYSVTGLLIHPTWGTLANKRSATGVIGHEILHQWFGDLVTCQWWEDAWLNEGFAAYYENWPWERVEPEWNEEDYFVTGRYVRAMRLDDQGTASPTHDQTIQDVTEISNAFGQQTYSKGACILRMMNNLVMGDNWDDVLFEYLTENQYGSGSDVKFFAALDKVVDAEGLRFDVSPSDVMKTWLHQSGLPVVTISRQVGTSEVMVTQKMYLRNPYVATQERYPSPYGYKWEIPVSMSSSADPAASSLEWLHQNNRRIDVEQSLGVSSFGTDDWILGNYGAKGYYRTNYDDGNWYALIKQLKSDHSVIPTYNRAMLLNDALYLSRADELDLSIALQLSEYLVSETEWAPLELFAESVDYLDSMVYSLSDYDLLRTYMRNLWDPTYTNLGFVPGVADANVLSTMFLRRRAVSQSCYYGNSDCINECTRLFNNWMSDEDDFIIIHPDIRDHVYCTAMETMPNQEEWDFLFGRYQYLQTIGDLTSLITNVRDGLTCSRQTFILSNFFNMAIEGDSRIRDSDRSSILQAIARNPIGQPIAWDYLNVNWTSAPYRMSIFLAATELFNTDYDLEVYDTFCEEHTVSSSSDQESIDDRRIYIQANIRWLKRNEQKLVDWLQTVTNCLPPCVTPDPPETPAVSLRLPTNLRPTHYDIEIVPDFYQPDPADFSYTGHVDIHLDCDVATDTVVLQYRQMSVDSVTVNLDPSGAAVVVTNATGDTDTEFYTVTLERQLILGEQVVVGVDYSASIGSSSSGMYWASYPDPDQGGVTRYQLATQLAITSARKTFPCLDEPAMKATFNLTLWRMAGYEAVSNMPLLRSEDKGNGWFADVFEPFSVVTSTYQVAFSVVEDFGHMDRTSALGILTRQWTQNRFIDAGFADYPDRITAPILDYYSNLFNNVYPLPKEDQISVAGKGGAMENWGLITYGYNALLVDPELSTAAEKERVALVVAHEDLHQWFGNLVTCAWWSDTWVNEASASYYEFWGMSIVEPDWQLDQIMVETNMWRALDVDAYGRTHPIHNPAVETPGEIDAMFSIVTYEKGSCVLRMMDQLVMYPHWNTSMEIVIDRYKYSSVDNVGYTAVLDEVFVANGIDLDGTTPSIVMNTWLDQMGYPVVTISLNPHDNITDVTVTQNLFLVDRLRPVLDERFPPASYKWEIPIDYITNIQPTFPQRWWLHQSDGQFVLDNELKSGEWVIANFMLHGFYRVNYDTTNWNALIAQLRSDHTVIYTSNRAQLIEDSFNLARGELLDLRTGMDLTVYLSNETEYLPWAAAESTLGYVDLMLDGSHHFSNFRDYMLRLTENNYERLGWDERQGDTHFDISLRTIILKMACKYGNTDCISQAITLFNSWKTSPNDPSIVGPDIREAVYCTVIKHSIGEDDWNFLFSRYTYYKDQDHFSNIRSRIATGLTCSRDIVILSRFYDLAKRGDPSIHPSDRNQIMSNIASNRIAGSTVWRHLDAEWDTHPNRNGILSALVRSFRSNNDLMQLERFYSRHPATESGQSSYNDQRMVIQANIRWWNKYGNALVNWFDM